MSASSDRATRRELRRAMGEGAISAMSDLHAQVQALTVKANEHTQQIDRLQNLAAENHGRLAAASLRLFMARSFWQRLHWLLTGR
jgi:hypothetical protein